MAYTAGIALNERDLIQKLDAFLTTNPDLIASGENWRRVHTSTFPATATQQERLFYCWAGPGTGNDEIFVSARSGGVYASDIYQMFFCGGVEFTPQLSTQEAPLDGFRLPTPNIVGLHCESRDFKYWMVANGRRFIVITNINRVYSSAYCGFMLPQLTPVEYPYPLVIAASTDAAWRRYSEDSNYTTSICDPRANNFWVLHPNLAWRDYYGAATTATTVTEAANRYVTPRGTGRAYDNVNNMISQLGSSPVTGFPLLPIEIVSRESAAMGGFNYWGMLEGVYWVPGMSRAAEDIITLPDGRTALVFQNGFRTTTLDYFGVITE